LYEKSQWVTDPKTGQRGLAPITSWDIGMLMTRHHEECRVRDELRRSARTGTTAERRLELAQSTACTCGARAYENNTDPIKVVPHDQRDNRDPEQVGLEHLNRLQ